MAHSSHAPYVEKVGKKPPRPRPKDKGKGRDVYDDLPDFLRPHAEDRTASQIVHNPGISRPRLEHTPYAGNGNTGQHYTPYYIDGDRAQPYTSYVKNAAGTSGGKRAKKEEASGDKDPPEQESSAEESYSHEPSGVPPRSKDSGHKGQKPRREGAKGPRINRRRAGADFDQSTDQSTVKQPTPRMVMPRGEEGGVSTEVDQYVWDAAHAKDLTVHLDLDLECDLEPALDEFSRLARLGRFSDAKVFYEANLFEQRRSPYVFVQYAQLLLDQGDYKGVKALTPPHGLPSSDVLGLNWRLISQLADLHIKGLHHDDVVVAFGEVSAALGGITSQIFRTAEDSWSTEIQLVHLILRIIGTRYQYENAGWALNVAFLLQLDVLQEYLIQHGRVWDFRDVFVGLGACGGKAWDQLLGAPLEDPDFAAKLVESWKGGSFDEATSLALLDMLASVCVDARLAPSARPALRRIMEASQVIAVEIAEADSALLMTRPYLRWCLAKIIVASADDMWDVAASCEKLPGTVLAACSTTTLPVYVPLKAEEVDWASFMLPPNGVEEIQLILNAARKLGDYEIEGICRQMLVRRSPEPLPLLDELLTFRKGVQADTRGWLHAALSKYILTWQSNERLREDLKAENPERFAVLLHWACDMVVGALSDPDEREEIIAEASKRLYQRTPGATLKWINRPLLRIGEFPAPPWGRATSTADDGSYEVWGIGSGTTRAVLDQLGYRYFDDWPNIVVNRHLDKEDVIKLESFLRNYQRIQAEIDRRAARAQAPPASPLGNKTPGEPMAEGDGAAGVVPEIRTEDAENAAGGEGIKTSADIEADATPETGEKPQDALGDDGAESQPAGEPGSPASSKLGIKITPKGDDLFEVETASNASGTVDTQGRVFLVISTENDAAGGAQAEGMHGEGLRGEAGLGIRDLSGPGRPVLTRAYSY